MRPLTFTKPKFLLPVGGKPSLDHVLNLLKKAKIDQVALVVGFGREQIMERYGDGLKLGLKIEYLHQKKLLGTADAVSQAEKFIGDDNFVVMNGDTLVDQESLNSIMKCHDKTCGGKGFGGVMGTIEVEDTEQFGIVMMKGDKVEKIVEKPKKSKSKLANAGVYLFSPAIFKAIKKTKKSTRGELELTTSIQIMINEGLHVHTAPLNLWADIGRPWDLLFAN